MRTQKKSNLKSLLLVLLLTAVLLVVSTYAWFTANKEVQVSDIEVNVEAQNGIEISVDGYTWKTVLSEDDLKNASATYAAAVNQLPATLQPVSTSGAIDKNGKMVMYYGAVAPDADDASETYGQYVLTSTDQTDANGATGNYVAFDIFLKVDSATESTPVYMTTKSNVTSSVKEGNTDTGLKNSTRVSFINEGHVATADISDIDTIQALKLDATVIDNKNTLTDSKLAYIWEPNSNIHTGSGISNAKTYYGKTILADEVLASYDGINSTFTTKVPLNKTNVSDADYGTYFKTVTPSLKTPVVGAKTQLTTLASGVTKVRVYMWVEGQDVDCENNASGSYITLNLDFTTTEG